MAGKVWGYGGLTACDISAGLAHKVTVGRRWRSKKYRANGHNAKLLKDVFRRIGMVTE